MMDYIFGYGSLIENESRMRTTPQAKTALPVKIKGFQRGWFARTGSSGLSTTFLGCIIDNQQYVNGVVYEINPQDLELTDQREKGYDRVRVPMTALEDYSGKVNSDANIWIYVNHFSDPQEFESSLPNAMFPIVQSYLDICINGCLEVEAAYPLAKANNFTADFITSISYWSNNWVNDRIFPRRPFIHRPNAYEIDRLLQTHLPDKELFDKIYFE